jgi:hypothetical protein
MITWYFNRIKLFKKNHKYSQLTIEITLIIIVKVALLWFLWLQCFSHPISKDARQLAVTRVILNQHTN